jgi:hypothetical protein
MCRGAEGQRGRGAEGQRGRGAEGQRGRGAEGQRGRGAEGIELGTLNSPLLPCSPAPLPFMPHTLLFFAVEVVVGDRFAILYQDAPN